jgi:hypothetical protein
MLGGALGQVGETLSAPRRWAWSALGLPESGSGTDLLKQTFNMDPESTWTKALGFGAEMALDPLTYLGAGVGKLAGSFGKGGALGKAAPKAITEYGNVATRAAKAEQLLGRSEAVAAGATNPGFQSLRPLRDNFTMTKGISFPEVPGAPGLGRRFIGGANTVSDNAVGAGIREFEEMAGADVGGKFITNAGYIPGVNVGVVPKYAAPSSTRHETIHGMIDALRQGIPSPNAPLAMRIPAALYRSERPFIRGLGQIADETVAHALSRKGFGNQVSGGLSYLFGQHPGYAQQILEGQGSPLAAAVYKNMPYLAGGGVAAATAAPAYYAFSQ